MEQLNLKHSIIWRICCSLALTFTTNVFFNTQTSKVANPAIQSEKAIVQVFERR